MVKPAAVDFPGKYELLDRLGQGGMAELFRARAVGTGGVAKLVALKRMLPELARDEALGAMLIDEARLVSNLSHPNVVQVYELGKDGSGYYIAMELVNGPNLADVLARLREKGQRLPEPLALDVLIAVLGALDTAHRLCDASGRPAGIVHRDVSPQNVLISDAGAVKLGDFGIAKARNRVTEETQSGGIKGKLPYMAPEQIRGTGVDGRTDQFAAGLLLWECLAGQRHYVGETDMEILWKAGEGRVRPLSEVGVTVNPQLEQIVSTALAVQPDARFPSCAEFARALTVYARKTWPDHDPAELASVVRSLFGAELRERAERLHRFEAGLEPTCGWVGGPAATDTARRAALSSVPIEPTLVPRTTGRQPVIRLTEVVAPAPAREPAGGSLAVEADEARRTPVDVPRLEEAPPPQTAEELAAI
ncbi:MAG: serine/threonine-protein kinase, partial [Myxococcales bacterium]